MSHTTLDAMKYGRTVVFAPSSTPVLLECPPIFKLYRCPDDFPRPPAMIGHYPLFFEYSFEERSGVRGITEFSYRLDAPPKFEDLPRFPIPDGLVHACDSARRMQEILDLINAISGQHIIRYGSYQSWFLAIGGDHTPRFGQEGYLHPYEAEIQGIEPSPNYEFLDPSVMRTTDQNGATRLVMLAALFRKYFACPDNAVKLRYREACRILARAHRLVAFDLSASFVLMVAAIEGLIQILHMNRKVERCEECNQEQYRVVRKFQNFLDEYCYEISKPVKERIYKLRSALVHQGKLLTVDQGRRSYIETAEDLKQRCEATINQFEYRTLMNAATACFRTFLYRQVTAQVVS